jgi:hypothetical protein
MPHRLGRLLSLLLILLLLAACRSLPRVPAGNVPDAGGTRDLAPPPVGASPVAPVATASLPAGPYPPTVVDFSPGAGRVIGTDAVLTWQFSEPMDQQSVTDGLRITPQITGGTPEAARGLVWADTQTVSLHAEGLAPGTRYEVHLEGVQSAAGLPLSGNRTFVFSTLAPLKVISVSPSDGAEGLRADVPVRVTFNRPVVGSECVGLRASGGGDCPRLPLVISPHVAGDGVWVHSTVYQFAARDGLAARAAYQVTLKPGFVSFDGGTVTGPTTWSFSTASPRIVAQWPTVGQPDVPLSATIRITFSTPMDQVLTGGAFSLVTEAGSAVAGTSLWEDNGAVLKFTPAEPLALGTTYRLRVGERARAVSSTPLENPQAWGFRTVPYPRLVGQAPERGARSVTVDAPLQLTFEGTIDAQSLASGV